jgi:hypothetical protein
MDSMQMYQAAHHATPDQPFHQHVLNPAAQTFVHSAQVGPNFESPDFFSPITSSDPQAVPQEKSIKALLHEPMPYCDSEYCGGFCRGLPETLPKIISQPTAKSLKAIKKACAKWEPSKFALFSLSSNVRKSIYRYALAAFQPKGTRKAFQLSVDLKALFKLGNLNGLLGANKFVRMECLGVWIELVDLQLYQHDVPWLHYHLHPLSVMGTFGAWNFRRLCFDADVNGVFTVRCSIDLDTRVLSIDLAGPSEGVSFLSVYEYDTHFYPDTVVTSMNPTTVKNLVSVSKQIGSLVGPLFKKLLGNTEVTKWGFEDIKMIAERFFAVARPAFYNIDVEEAKDKWANFIDPADRVLYGLDEEWRPRITNGKAF